LAFRETILGDPGVPRDTPQDTLGSGTFSKDVWSDSGVSGVPENKDLAQEGLQKPTSHPSLNFNDFGIQYKCFLVALGALFVIFEGRRNRLEI